VEEPAAPGDAGRFRDALRATGASLADLAHGAASIGQKIPRPQTAPPLTREARPVAPTPAWPWAALRRQALGIDVLADTG